MSNSHQLLLLPGLGADRRLFEPQRQAFPQLVVPPWIPPRKTRIAAGLRRADGGDNLDPRAIGR